MFTTYGANAILDGTPVPATLYAKLHVGDPGVNATANPATESSLKTPKLAGPTTAHAVSARPADW